MSEDAAPNDARLNAALAAIQARGAIGEASLPRAIEHAEQFLRQIPPEARALVDLGSGGGLPGLVIAVHRPDLSVTLVERRHTRADLLRRAVRSLDLQPRVTVLAEDAKQLAARAGHSFDVVTARSFAAPPITARWGSALLVEGGVMVVSEPPEDDPHRWPASLVEPLGLVDLGRDRTVRVFRRVTRST